MCTVGTNASIKELKKVVIENIFGIPLMLCVCGFFFVQGGGDLILILKFLGNLYKETF